MLTTMSSTTRPVRLTALLLVASLAFGAETASADSICTSLKYKAAGKAAFSKAKCQAYAVRKGLTVDAGCLAKANATLAKRWARAEKKADCVETNELAAAGTVIDDFIAALVVALEAPTPTPVPTASPVPTATPALGSVCCDTGNSCLHGNPIDEIGCTGMGGTVGAAGTVCDGVTGTCQPAPAGTGSCCFHPGLVLCEGGPNVDPVSCVQGGGLDFPFESRCEPDGTCSFTGP
jgi:hypothetical protein